MKKFNIVVFGCWNKGCKINSGQKSVSDLIKLNESKYKFMVILGDNYYAEKKTLSEKLKLKIKEIDMHELISGFKCLENINLEKKLIMGNHDIGDSVDKSCSSLKIQLKLPTYDVKFPFGFDLYYLYADSENETYETILIIYLDTSLYGPDFNDDNSCYKSTLNIDIDELRMRQNEFISETLEKINKKIYNINSVIFFAHDPLFTFKNKKKKQNMSLVNTQLLKKLFDEKTKYNKVEFYWICADYHIYQNSIITNNAYPGHVIKQWIFGTGGGDLDKPPTTNICEENDNKLEILPNIVVNSAGLDISHEFDTFGVEKYGYGEISFDFCSVSHKFIQTDFMSGGGIGNEIGIGFGIGNEIGNENGIGIGINYKSKYLKYKSKYVELKKLM